MEICYDLIFYLTFVFKYSVEDVENMTPFEAEIFYNKCVAYEMERIEAEKKALSQSNKIR